MTEQALRSEILALRKELESKNAIIADLGSKLNLTQEVDQDHKLGQNAHSAHASIQVARQLPHYVSGVASHFSGEEKTLLGLCKEGDSSAVRNILLNKASQHKRSTLAEPTEIWDEHGTTPLHAAVKSGSHDLVSFLVDKTSNVSKSEAHLHNMLGKLLERRMHQRMNLSDEKGRTAFHYLFNHFEDDSALDLCKLFLTCGASPTRADKSGRTPFLDACDTGRQHCAMTMIQATEGTCLLYVDSENRNAAHLSARSGSESIIAAIVKIRPSMLMAKDREGKSAAQLAKEGGHTELAKMIEKTVTQLGKRGDQDDDGSDESP